MKTWLIGIAALLLWYAGCTYWYVCRIQCACQADSGTTTPIVDSPNPASEPISLADTTSKTTKKPLTDSVPALLTQPHTVLFAFATPQPEHPAAFEAYIDALASFLNANPYKQVRLQGYTDDTAARENNIKLSQRRIDAIAGMLHARNVRNAQIVAEPLGEADPVATNETEAGRRLNRRVVITLLP